MNKTSHYGFGKPLSTEKHSVSVQNNNMDLIDSALNELESNSNNQEETLDKHIKNNKELIDALTTTVGNQVSSVNGQTGDVNLDAEDVGALPSYGGEISNDDKNMGISTGGLQGDMGQTISDFYKVQASIIDGTNILYNGENTDDRYVMQDNVLTTAEEINANTDANGNSAWRDESDSIVELETQWEQFPLVISLPYSKFTSLNGGSTSVVDSTELHQGDYVLFSYGTFNSVASLSNEYEYNFKGAHAVYINRIALGSFPVYVTSAISITGYNDNSNAFYAKIDFISVTNRTTWASSGDKFTYGNFHYGQNNFTFTLPIMRRKKS